MKRLFGILLTVEAVLVAAIVVGCYWLAWGAGVHQDQILNLTAINFTFATLLSMPIPFVWEKM